MKKKSQILTNENTIDFVYTLKQQSLEVDVITLCPSPELDRANRQAP